MTNRITFSQAIQGYLLHANARRLSKHTLADYTTTFRKFHHFLDGDPPLASITPAQLRTFLACQDGISNKTFLNYQSLLGHSTMDMVQTYLKLAQHDLDASHHLASPLTIGGFIRARLPCQRIAQFTLPTPYLACPNWPHKVKSKYLWRIRYDHGSQEPKNGQYNQNQSH